MEPGTRIDLPPHVTGEYEVFVNGVPQRPGEDYEVVGRTLLFPRPLAREGRLGFWRWVSLFMGVAGTYRKHDNVDVVYSVDGRRTVIQLEPTADDAVSGS